MMLSINKEIGKGGLCPPFLFVKGDFDEIINIRAKNI
jgi:hypothetical protein